MAPGSPPPASLSTRVTAARLRTALVVAGCGFVIASAVAACLDHYEEDYGCAPGVTTGASSGGECDASAAPETSIIGSGSESAAP